MRLPRPGIRTKYRNLTAPSEVKKLYAKFSADTEATYILGFDDCVSLYRMVRTLKPGLVVEFGSGIGTGTAMIAAALEANGSGNVISLEHLGFLRDTAKRLIPDSLFRRVEIVVAEAENREYFGQEWACYRWKFNGGPIDMVIVDGPPTEWTNPSGDPDFLPNGDLIELVPFLSERASVFVDGRQRSVDCYKQYLSDQLEFVKESRGLSEFTARHAV